MKIEFTKKELRVLRIAINSAIQSEESLIDAHSCQFCSGTKVFQGRACHCKTGVMKGSIKIVKDTNPNPQYPGSYYRSLKPDVGNSYLWDTADGQTYHFLWTGYIH